MAAQCADQPQVQMHALRPPLSLQLIFILNYNNFFFFFTLLRNIWKRKQKGSSSPFIFGLISAMCKCNVGTSTAGLCIPSGHKATEKPPLRNTGQKTTPDIPSMLHIAYRHSQLETAARTEDGKPSRVLSKSTAVTGPRAALLKPGFL